MALDPRWRRVQELAAAAEAYPSAERSAWLDSAESDSGIRAEAADLLAGLEAEAEASLRAARPAAAPQPGVIGPYRIVERAGSGGRGAVYRAVREVAGGMQEVALKLLREPLSAPEDLERFRREQRILAGLNHPAIARFLDAGIDSRGHPYLAMEWIDGQPLDRYARTLAMRDRVRLAAEVLDALHAAHQSLVVHLDIKPSNILVDRAGRVRLIDFGTAKLLGAEGAATETRQFTPSHASPEQLRGEPASTASDVYSVGLTLLDLLTGKAPHGSSLAALAERATSESAEVTVPGEPDLEAILRKALRFTPGERYRGAAEFADDLRAWLGQRPVRARRATAWYRFQRFAARRWRFLLTAAALAAVIVGMAIYSHLLQRDRLRQAQRAASIANFLRGMIDSSATAAVGRSQLTVLEMVRRAHERLEVGAAVPADVAALLQSDFAYFARESGRDQEAEQFARAALRRAGESGDPEAGLAARRALAETVLRLGLCGEAVQLYREADSMLARRAWRPFAEASYLAARAAAKSRCEADPRSAVALLDRAIELSARLEPADTALSPNVFRASLHNSLALELTRLRQFDEARSAVTAGLREADAHLDGRYFRVALRRVLGQLEANAGRHGDSLAAFEAALAMAPGVTDAFEELRLDLMAAAQLAELGQRQKAIARARTAASRIDASEHGAARWMLFADAAEVMARARACPEVAPLYAKADAITNGTLPRDWQGNRLLYTAECTPDRSRAAALAREALAAYGQQLHADSPRRRRLEALIGAESR